MSHTLQRLHFRTFVRHIIHWNLCCVLSKRDSMPQLCCLAFYRSLWVQLVNLVRARSFPLQICEWLKVVQFVNKTVICFQGGISEQDLTRAKNSLKAAVFMALEDSDNLVTELGLQVSYDCSWFAKMHGESRMSNLRCFLLSVRDPSLSHNRASNNCFSVALPLTSGTAQWNYPCRCLGRCPSDQEWPRTPSAQFAVVKPIHLLPVMTWGRTTSPVLHSIPW